MVGSEKSQRVLDTFFKIRAEEEERKSLEEKVIFVILDLYIDIDNISNFVFD